MLRFLEELLDELNLLRRETFGADNQTLVRIVLTCVVVVVAATVVVLLIVILDER